MNLYLQSHPDVTPLDEDELVDKILNYIELYIII
jgi:hypothetical protein